MKKIENNFAVTGFVGKDAEIRQFTTASVARFSLAIGRSEKNGEENNRVSAFINVEAWRKNENADSFDKLTKGAMLTVEGYFKPEEWSDQEGVKHNRVVLVATKFNETPDKEDAPKEEEKSSRRKTKQFSSYFRFPTSHTTVRAVRHTAVPILDSIRDTNPSSTDSRPPLAIY